MSAFHLYQRVRIVASPYPQFVGLECVLVDTGDVSVGHNGERRRGWCTDLKHPVHHQYPYGVFEDQIEPLKYLPAPEDFVTTERVYEPDCPVRDPAVSAEGVA